MNTRAKGMRNQRKTHVALEKQGWEVFTPPMAMYAKNKDIFNLFDHVAAKSGEKLKFVQTKSNKCPKKVKVAISRVFTASAIDKEIWIWHDRIKTPEIIKIE